METKAPQAIICLVDFGPLIKSAIRIGYTYADRHIVGVVHQVWGQRRMMRG